MRHLKKATRRTVAALTAALGLGAGLSASAAALTTSASDELQLRTGARVTEARLRGDNLLGPDIQLSRYGGDLRGRAYRAPVDLSSHGNTVTGQLGTRPVRLQLNLNPTGPGVQARGLVAGQISDLRIAPTFISGRVGRCSYDLRQVGDHYEGSRQCGGMRVAIPTTLQLPQGMAALPDTQATAVLGMLLAR